MERCVCLHGHFYQPDRTNPWTGRVDPEPSAAPYPDWNHRIDAECYRPNAAARRIDTRGRVAGLVRTYEHLSFNVGASLLGWLAEHDPWTYGQILEADAASASRFGGHGSALAQPWVHAILPLASARDRDTLVHWGVRDFIHRFGRTPEGMWLPETAADTATLDALARAGISFTIVAPWQVEAVRPGPGDWRPVDAHTLDTTRPYRCALPAGRSIALFAYHGELSAAVAFGGLLHDGDTLAARLRGTLVASDPGEVPVDPLVHLATDGESYGHHHRFGEMALARAIEALEADPRVRLTNYAEYLAGHPPTHQARLAEGTSWSCAHGIERWRADCGCHLAGEEGWTQAWRAPLRDAIDWLGEELGGLFESAAAALVDDPWAARQHYIDVLVEPTPARQRRFLAEQGGRWGNREAVLCLLESQRHLLEASESSAWFYDDPAGGEVVLALRHAARALDLVGQVTGSDRTPEFVRRLRALHSNQAGEGDGGDIWQRHVIGARPEPGAVAREVVAEGVLSGRFPARIGAMDVRAPRPRHLSSQPLEVLAGHVQLTHRSTGVTSHWCYVVARLGGPALQGVVLPGAAPPEDLVASVAASAGRPRALLDRLVSAAGGDPLTATDLPEVVTRRLLTGVEGADAETAVQDAALAAMSDPTDEVALARLVETVRVLLAVLGEPVPGSWWAQTAAVQLAGASVGIDVDLLRSLADAVGVAVSRPGEV